MIPAARVFFEEVSSACAATADALGLTGPHETERVMPVAAYKGDGVSYRVRLDDTEGSVECGVMVETDTGMLTTDIETLALAVRAVDRRGAVSYSARNVEQLRKSLLGQAEYVRLVHPFLTGGDPEGVLRRAGAREWRKDDGS